MRLHELRPAKGAKKARKRKGRGISAGQGKTAGRGTKGQNARSGGGKGPYFEGGQLPLVRRLPYKGGFINRWKVFYRPVNISRLAIFPEGSEVDPAAMAELLLSVFDGVVLHDIFAEHLKYRESEVFCPEPVHPGRTGHVVIANAVLEALHDAE